MITRLPGITAVALVVTACGGGERASMPEVPPFSDIAGEIGWGMSPPGLRAARDVYDDGRGRLHEIRGALEIGYTFSVLVDSGPPPNTSGLVTIETRLPVRDSVELYESWRGRVASYRAYTGTPPVCSRVGGMRARLLRAEFPLETLTLAVEAEVIESDDGQTHEAALGSSASVVRSPTPEGVRNHAGVDCPT